MKRRPARSVPAAAAILALLLVVTACSAAGGGAGAQGSPGATTHSPATPLPTVDHPIDVQPAPGGGGPGTGGELTIPQPGQLDVHPIGAQLLEAEAIGRAVTVRITFTSGVAPCAVLDSIAVDRSELALTLTLREGHGPGNNVCIEIARINHALVDLGELDPGVYTIRDGAGGATPIQVTVN